MQWLITLINGHYIASFLITILLYVTIESLTKDIKRVLNKKQGKPAVL